MSDSSDKLAVEVVRDDFPLLAEKVRGKSIVYLDNAATALKPWPVIEAVTSYNAAGSANIHRGVHFLSEKASAKYENARKTVAAFINAKQNEEVIFTSGTTFGINLVAQGWGRFHIKSGDEILISQMEHHANIVPWQMLSNAVGAKLRVIPMNSTGELLIDEYKKLLNSRTRLIAVSHVSNVLGTINPIRDIIAAARKVGAVTLVDGAQAIAHLPVDVQELDCDFYLFSGHKLFAPTGVGVLYGKKSLLEAISPVIGGGNMVSRVTFEKTTYAPLPERLEAGTPNISGVIALASAINYLQKLGRKALFSHEAQLVEYGLERFGETAGLKLIGTAKARVPIFSFTYKEVHAHDIATILDQEGIAIRSGHHCCQPIMDFYGLMATARASLAFYNTKDDIDHCLSALERVDQIFAV